ncbi:hypothetical protein [Candidatus Viadribacter manganicus]|uniref:Uncharacterized protein n=1 Tax=Candidatus Viadribacter manganicus TaxID=1759059 RepID=A0A1B1ALM8_9PROT|nr:hypothetical protein [Candidatus Viadribacter manganicus]ANP47421.1 hypothetical protein ATE48_16640 [Candidatus Viadribacter manganicus]
MRYRIEFLRQTTEGGSVCSVRAPLDVELATARFQAHVWSASVREEFGATGFQIRDLRNAGCIVTLEDFDGPPPTLH